VVSIVGLGLGPLVTGMISDLLTSGYGLGKDSLRYAIAASAIPVLWGAVHFSGQRTIFAMTSRIL
jgi:hypothetical protein